MPDAVPIGTPSTPDFQLGVFAERLQNLQQGLVRVESSQQQTLTLIKEMNSAHNDAMLKLGNVEQRTTNVESDVAAHTITIERKADEVSMREVEEAVKKSVDDETFKNVVADVEDLKKSKWMILGVSGTISLLIGLLAVAAPFVIHH